MVGETKKSLICLVGMGAFCAMLRPPFFGTLTTGMTPGLSTLRIAYDVALIVLGCLLAAMSLIRAKTTISNDPLAHTSLVGLLAVASVVAVSVGRLLGVSAEGYYLACIMVLCVGFGALVVGWFYVLVRLPRDRIAPLVMAAFVLSHVFGIIDLLPREWALVLSVLYPLLAAAMLLAQRGDSSALPDQSEPLLRDDYLRKVQILTIVLIVAELICGAFLRGRWVRGGVNYVPYPSVGYTYLISAAIGALFWIVARRSRSTAESALVIGGMSLMGFMVATLLFTSLPMNIFVPCVTGLYSALLAYSMALISLWGLDGRHSSLACAGLFMGMFGLISGITSSIIPAILSHYQLTPAEILFPMGVAAGLVISLGMCAALFVMVIFHRELFLNKLERGTDGDVKEAEHVLTSEERHERAMHAVADRYALTEREEQTASLLARGYTAKHVADEMGVAVSTVKGYSKTIYTKMGIHRKDELIEIVKAAKDHV